MSFPHDNNLVPWHQTNLKPLLCRSFLENFFPVVKNKFGDDVTETILTNAGKCSVAVVRLGKKQEFCKAILRDAVSFCLQDVLFLRILFANFLLCLLFFVFSVLLLDDILFF